VNSKNTFSVAALSYLKVLCTGESIKQFSIMLTLMTGISANARNTKFLKSASGISHKKQTISIEGRE
jgi:hypothetical protein